MSLVVKAGQIARRWLETEGFNFERIELMLGASGGPKWLVLSPLDRYLATQKRSAPLHLLGTSSGAWRFSCYGQADPVRALERLESAYIEQTYPRGATPAQVTTGARRVLQHALGLEGAAQVLAHPTVRFHVMAAGMRGLTRSERLPVQLAGLIAAGLANLVSRRLLRAFFYRAVFSDPRATLPLDLAGFSAREVPLTPANLEQAVLASGSIPLRLEGQRDIPGAPKGVYRDGALLEYNFDLPMKRGSPPSAPLPGGTGFVLFPHFLPYLVPGWLDRFVPWRRPRAISLDRMILVHPSRDFLEQLPGGRIPDLTDFRRFDDRTRTERWRQAARAGEALVEAFQTWQKDPRVEPLTVATSRPFSLETLQQLAAYARL